MSNLVHIGDIFAIPMFALLVYYFYDKSNNKYLTKLEYILYMFAITGLIADIYFTIEYLKN